MKLILFLLLLYIGTAYNWRIFHNGRSVGGNIGKPNGNSEKVFADQWFTQNLDHFSPTNLKTWQQVTVTLRLQLLS